MKGAAAEAAERTVTVTNRGLQSYSYGAKGDKSAPEPVIVPGRNVFKASEWEAMAPHFEGLTVARKTPTGDAPPILEVY